MGIKHKFVSAIAEGADAGVVRVSNWNEEHVIEGGLQNFLINGSFRVAQRGTTFDATTSPLNSDDTYLLDRWILLSDGNDIVDVSQETAAANLPTGVYAGAKFDIETQDKKWGQLQIIEAKDSAALIGNKVSLTFQAARGAGDTSTLMRAAVIAWDGAADTVTSDVVSVWEAEGTNPTLVANWTYENVPTALTGLTDAYQTFTIENIDIDTASTTNVALFIWSDDMTNAVGDLVYITGAKLEVGETATDFVARHYEKEEALCQRYYQRFGGGTDTYFVMCGATGATGLEGTFMYIIPMRAAPTFGSGGNFETNLGAIALTALGTDLSTTISARISGTVAGGLTQGFAYNIRADSDATAYMQFAAEL